MRNPPHDVRAAALRAQPGAESARIRKCCAAKCGSRFADREQKRTNESYTYPNAAPSGASSFGTIALLRTHVAFLIRPIPRYVQFDVTDPRPRQVTRMEHARGDVHAHGVELSSSSTCPFDMSDDRRLAGGGTPSGEEPHVASPSSVPTQPQPRCPLEPPPPFPACGPSPSIMRQHIRPAHRPC